MAACRSHRRRIERYFESGLNARGIRRLRAHARSCDHCARYYDRLARLEAGLAGPSVSAEGFVAPRAERLLGEIHDRRRAPGQVPAWRLWGWALPATGFALATLAVLLWRAPSPEEAQLDIGGQHFTVRGFAETPGASRRLGLRVFCLLPNALAQKNRQTYTLSEIFSSEYQPQGGICASTGIFYFTASNVRPEPWYLFVVGVDDDRQLRWYYPKPSQAGSYRLDPDTLDRPLGRGIELRVHHRPGRQRIWALFTREALTVAEVEERLRAKPGLDEGAVLKKLVAPSQGQLLRFQIEIR